MKSLCFVLAASLLINATQVSAQLGGVAPAPSIPQVQGPTLEQTQKWIVDKVASVPAGEQWYGVYEALIHDIPRRVTWQVSFIGNGCDVAFVAKNGEGVLSQIWVFSLPDVRFEIVSDNVVPKGSRRHDISAHMLAYETVNQDSLIRYATAWEAEQRFPSFQALLAATEKRRKIARPGDFITVSSFEIVDRLKTAFEHAQKICVGKIAEERAARMQQDAARNGRKPGELF